MKATIYCGVPGAGKTTCVDINHPFTTVHSADHYFMSADGEYKFDASKLPQAHAACLRGFVGSLMMGEDVVVDNTNTTVAEIAPYAALALAYGYDLLIRTVECDPDVAAARNVHGVPVTAVRAMADRLAKRELLPWWRHEVVHQ